MGRENLLICASKTKDRINVAKVVSLFRPNKFKYHHDRAPEIATTLDLPMKKRCRSRLACFSVSGLGAFSHVYEVRPRSDKRGVDLISDALPFGRLSYVEVCEASQSLT